MNRPRVVWAIVTVITVVIVLMGSNVVITNWRIEQSNQEIKQNQDTIRHNFIVLSSALREACEVQNESAKRQNAILDQSAKQSIARATTEAEKERIRDQITSFKFILDNCSRYP